MKKRIISMITALSILLSFVQMPLVANAAGEVVYYNYVTDLQSHSDVKDASSGCYTCSLAMILSTLGKDNATPYDIWRLNGNKTYISSYDAIAREYNVTITKTDLKGTADERYNTIYALCQQNPQGVFLQGTKNDGVEHAVVAYIDSSGTLRIHNPGWKGWNGRIVGQTDKNFSSYSQFYRYRIIRDNGAPSTPSTPVTFSNTRTEWVKDTTAKIYTDISANVRNTSYVGCRWGTSAALEQKELSWSTAKYSKLDKCDVTFDGKEAPTLNPGTTYYYRFFVVDKNGEYHFAEMQSFKTTGGDEEPPVFGDVWVTDISPSGYTISCTVTDNKGVNRVQFPSWTLYNDQDDIVDEWWTNPKATGTQNGNTWTFRVNTSDHNNESGIYHTHIYAYDDAGNKSVKEQNYIDVPAILYFDSNGGESKENSTWMYYGKENNNNVSWNTITRDGYTFLGWYTSLTDGAQIYDADGQCTNEGIYFLNNCWNTTVHDLTIYAHWQEIENPDPENPNPENPDPENPNPENPDPENPDPENPDPENPDPENPDPENPDPENPDPENPDPENPDPENPDPENPDPENPDPENPDPENPDPENPDPENPDPEDPDPVNPDPVNPDPEKPDAPNEKPEEQPAQSSGGGGGGGDGAALLIVGAAAVGAAAVVYYHRDALPIWQLNGIVKLEDGTPVAGATVALMQGENVIKTLTTNSNGVYTARVAKGDYQAVVTWSQDGVQYTKQAWVTTETAGGDAGMQEIILDRQA